MKNRKAAIAAVRECRTRDDLDEMLEHFEVSGTAETVGFLNECMHSPLTFGSPGETIAENEMEFAKQIFLTGTWRLNDLYDKIGIKEGTSDA